MQLPLILKGFNVFIDGLSKYGVVATVKRPKIAYKTEEFTPGGGLGEMSVIHGLEKLELEIKCKGYDYELLKAMSHKINGNLIRYQGALHKEDEEEYKELVGEARGRIVEADAGEDKAGEGGEHTFKIALTYWKESLGSEVIVEADFMNNVLVIGGTDIRTGMRAALGLA